MLDRLLTLALALATLTISAPFASAQDDRTAQAREEYNIAAEAFGEGRFGEALDRFSRAYEFSPRGELLYNIGTAHDRLGHRENALEFYRAYLEAIPDANNRLYTEARIEVLEAEAAVEAARQAARDEAEASERAAITPEDAAEALEGAETAETEEPEQPAEASGGANIPAIALVSVAGAAAVGAVVTGIMALGQRSDLEDACDNMICTSENQSDLDRLNALTITTDVLIGVAAAAAAVGVVLFIVGGDDDEDATVSCGLSGCSGRLRF